MKILFIANALDKPEQALISGLIAKNIKVHLILARGAKLTDDLVDSLSSLSYIPLESRLDIYAIYFIRNFLKKNKPDIIHSLSGRALSNALIASIGYSIKHVAYRGTMGNLSYWDPASRMSFLNSRVNKIICVSDAVRNDLIRIGVAPKKLVRIYKGHNPDWYKFTATQREQYGLEKDTIIITCVANSRPVKGIDLLIKAFRQLSADIDACLCLIGEDRGGSLARAAANDARIKFFGFREDAAQIVSVSDIFCMPSRRREGFPKALIEAMIQGVPAVVSDVGGMPEIVTDGEQGLVVPAEDVPLLSLALLRLVNDKELRRSMSEKARDKILKSFTFSLTIDQTFELYQSL